MNSDIRKWVMSCDRCQRVKDPQTKLGLLQPTTSGTLQGKTRWALDVLGPLPKTATGEQFILVMIDVTDGWPEAFALKEHVAGEVVRVLSTELVPRHGIPDEILTDRGSEFLAAEAMRFYQSYGITKKSTTAFHPQADGAAEALVKKIKGGAPEELPKLVQMERRSSRGLNGVTISSSWGDGYIGVRTQTWQKDDATDPPKVTSRERETTGAEREERNEKCDEGDT